MARRRMKDLWAEAEQDKNLATIGGRIRYARLSQGLTQQQVADALPDDGKRKKSRASIAQYETASPDHPPGLDVIADLAVILNEDPCYLAFGDRSTAPNHPIPGQHVPIKHLPDPVSHSPRLRRDLAPSVESEQCAIFPRELLTDLGAGRGRTELVRVEFDAPIFGIRKHEYVLVDADVGDLKADGQLYAIATPTGVALVRSEPVISESTALHLTSGYGGQQQVNSDSISVLGRVLASFQRRS